MAVNIGTRAGRHHGPNGSFEGCRVPYSGAVNALLIINPRSGRGGPAPEEIAAETKAYAVDVRTLQPGEDPAEIRAAILRGRAGDGGRRRFARRGGGGCIGAGRGVRLRALRNAQPLRARPRPRPRRPSASSRAFARLRTWATLLTDREPLGITIDGEPVESRLVLVGNNAYAVDFPSLGARERLDEGKLHLYVGTDERVGDSFVVDSRAHRLEAAVDGEPDVLATPIEFRIEPRALRVLVPDSGG